jgi:hypothetical protein
VPGAAAPDLRCDGDLAERRRGVRERVQRGQLRGLRPWRHAVQWPPASDLRPEGHVAKHWNGVPVRLHGWPVRWCLQAEVRPVQWTAAPDL